MKVWVVANQKGGVGKTTTTVALGGLLAADGYRTLLLDLDPQGSLTSYFRFDPDTITPSSYTLFQAVAEKSQADPLKLVRDTDVTGLSILPASTGLVTLDRCSARLEGMLGLVIDRALGVVGQQFDYVLIDCPALLGVLLINALAAGDFLLLPVQTDFLAIKGLERMLRTLGLVLRSRPRPLPHLIVPTFFDQRTRIAQESLAALQREYSEQLWEGVIPVDTAIREASQAGVLPSAFRSRSRGVRAYRRLLDHLLTISAARFDGRAALAWPSAKKRPSSQRSY